MALKFSIITPSFNSQRFIKETIQSVVNQKGNFSIEYIIVDSCSTDNTRAIIEKYQRALESDTMPINCIGVTVELISESDFGMYDAIKKGFAHATGDLFAWINSDDIYLQGSFNIIQRTFEKYPQIMWLKGITSYINEESVMFASGKCNLYHQELIKRGLYGPVLYFIQQDSVFWRSDLWHRSGGLDANISFAGDYLLWRKFSVLTQLYSLSAHVSCFRKVAGQKSENIQMYWKEVSDHGGLSPNQYKTLRKLFEVVRYVPYFLRPVFYRLLLGKHKYHMVTLDAGMEPSLHEGNYYALEKRL